MSGIRERLSGIPDVLIRELKGIQGSEGGVGVETYRTALLNTRLAALKLSAERADLASAPLVYCTVIAVLPQVTAATPDVINAGTRVRVVHSSHPETIGRTGFVLNNEGRPDADGEIVVGFDDDTIGFFGIGIPGAKNAAREIEIVPDDRPHVLVALDGRQVELPYTPTLTLQVGDRVAVRQSAFEVVSEALDPELGELTEVIRIAGPGRCIVTFGDSEKSALIKEGLDVSPGDQVVLDPSGSVVITNLGSDDRGFFLRTDTGVRFEDIVGLDDAKEQIREALFAARDQATLYAFYRKRQIHGILLVGPPGNGKTMLAQATATALREDRANRTDEPSGIIYVNGPSILESLVGKAEHKIIWLFGLCRRYQQRYGRRAILIIDECEAILRKRGTGKSSDVETTIVPTFLSEMDGIIDSGAIVFLLTNRPDVLDPAVVRSKRIDRTINVDRPSKIGAVDVFSFYLGKLPLENGLDVRRLAEHAVQLAYSSTCGLYGLDLRATTDPQDPIIFTLGDIMSCAMIEGIVDLATSNAIKREGATGTPHGLTEADLMAAVISMFSQQRYLDNTDVITAFVLSHNLSDRFLGVHMLTQGSQ